MSARHKSNTALTRTAIAAVVMTATLFASCVLQTQPARAATTPAESSMVNEIVAQINAERAARSLPPLTADPTLAALAQDYAQGQAEGTNPPGDASYLYSQHSAYQWFGFGSAAAGVTTPSSTFTLLIMSSTPHRDTVMQNVPGQGIGIGIACNASGQAWMQYTVGSTTAPDPSYTSNTPASPVVTPSGTGSSCASPTPPPTPQPRSPSTGLVATPSGDGYWVTDTRGDVYAHGAAHLYGDASALTLNAPISHIVATPDGRGYWLVAADGGTFSYGDAGFYGSMGASHLNAPVVDIAPTPTGRGYWLVASDGGVFAFGDAQFYGSMGAMPLNRPVVGIAQTRDGRGYWLVASDGGVFAFGDAGFYGSTGATPLNAPIVSLAPSPSGAGYWFVAADGGVFAFGDAPYRGSAVGQTSAPVVSMAADPSTNGYWVLNTASTVYDFAAPSYP